VLYSSQVALFQKPLHTLPAAIQLRGCTVQKATIHTACCNMAPSLYCDKSHFTHCLLLYSSQFVLFQKTLVTLPAVIQHTDCTVPKATPHTACCYTVHSLYYSKSHSSHCLLLYSSQFVLFQKPVVTLPVAIQLTGCTVQKATPHTACCYTDHRVYCAKSHSTHCLLLYSSQFVLFQKPLVKLPAAIQLRVCTVRKATPHTACCCTAHSLYCSKRHSSHCLLLYGSQFIMFQNPLLTLPSAIQLTVCTVPKATHHTACCYTAHSLSVPKET